MARWVFHLRSPAERQRAQRVVEEVPAGFTVTVAEPSRSADQNAKMWAMLTDISRARPGGRVATPDTWKLLVMHACGHECQFEMGLNGQPFPSGFRSSRLSTREMGDMIEWLYAFGAEHGVQWSEPHPDQRGAA